MPGVICLVPPSETILKESVQALDLWLPLYQHVLVSSFRLILLVEPSLLQFSEYS